MSDIDPQIQHVADLFNKPYDFTEAVISLHGVSLPLPATRHPMDGLQAFYSDMTSDYNTEPSLTKQEFTKTCDPNTILDRHIRGQDISMSFQSREPRYGDFTNLPTDFHTALNTVTAANQAFMQLDADIRAKFDNDPGKFIEYVTDPANEDKLYELGLADAPKPNETSVSAEPVPVPSGGGGGGGLAPSCTITLLDVMVLGDTTLHINGVYFMTTPLERRNVNKRKSVRRFSNTATRTKKVNLGHGYRAGIRF